ncbi:hypothetical protein [Shinella sp.]|uniref:hypothetical protein n=1 Tax=Shinella sp. TaxID=1870904 RepID=UPI003F6FC4FE
MTKLRPLTPKEHAALQAYALENGSPLEVKAERRLDECPHDRHIAGAAKLAWSELAGVVFRAETGNASEGPPFAVTVTADNGDIYEATRASKNEAWTITYPEGQDRFAGTEAELRAHIKRLISTGPAAKNAP